jgi:SAM-dependent methyltransferase
MEDLITYEQVMRLNRASYDARVDEREGEETQAWKAGARLQFLQLLQRERLMNMLEIGAGTGVHGAYFQESGIRVISTDNSQPMVDSCLAKGLDARRMNFMSLAFEDESFDAVFAMNCLLHVPQQSLPEVLTEIRRVLREGGILYWGQYGGKECEGIKADDHYDPKRFFSFLSDASYQSFGRSASFSLERFDTIKVAADHSFHFQSAYWRRES